MATRIAIVPGLDKSIGLGIVRRLAKELPDEVWVRVNVNEPRQAGIGDRVRDIVGSQVTAAIPSSGGSERTEQFRFSRHTIVALPA